MTELLTDKQIAEREAAYIVLQDDRASALVLPNAAWMRISLTQEPALLARLHEAERLLDDVRKSLIELCESGDCGNYDIEDDSDYLRIVAYFARVRQTGA